ncbi:MAG: LysM peptidoglycan-binding domain-containing protein [Eubacteriales bacterium]|nr:LysM peptidoglycan-binding domain-containing protein [Eubacteriales bacterium]
MLHTTVDKDLELESSLPDYCPDISRLIRVDCVPVIESSEINGEKCVVVGKIICNMIYETDYKNKVKSAVFEKDFTHNFDVPMQNSVDPVPEVTTRCAHISCKMLSPRKFIIKSRVELNLDVFASTVMKTADTESGDNTFYKTVEISYEKKLKPYNEEFDFEEEIPLMQNEKSVGEIVYGNIRLQPPQVTVTGNDAHIKTNAVIKLLYEAENSDNELIMSTKILPLVMTMSNLDINEENRISVSLSVPKEKLSIELDTYGENRVIRAEFTAFAKAAIAEKVNETVATDMFSSDCLHKTENATVNLLMAATEFDRTFAIDTEITPDRTIIAPLFDTDITINELKAEQSEGGVVISGTYTVSILGLTNEGVESFDFTGEFSEFITADFPMGVGSIEVSLYPFDYTSTMMSDGNISLRIIINAKIRAYTEEMKTFISTIISQDPLAKEKESYSVVYYYPSKTDSLWTIAKKYYVNPSAIKAANPNTFDENDMPKIGTRMVLIKK